MNTIIDETDGKKAPEELALKIQATNGDIWDTGKFDDEQRIEHVIKGSVTNDLWIAAAARTRGHPLLTCDRIIIDSRPPSPSRSSMSRLRPDGEA